MYSNYITDSSYEWCQVHLTNDSLFLIFIFIIIFIVEETLKMGQNVLEGIQ